MESKLEKFAKSKYFKNLGVILEIILSPIKIISIRTISFALNYLKYYILVGLSLIYFGIFIIYLNIFGMIKLINPIFEFLAIFYPVNLTYGAETPPGVLIQILMMVSVVFTIIIIVIKFLIKKIFKINTNTSFKQELLIKILVNTNIFVLLFFLSKYLNFDIGNGIFPFYIISSILILLSMFFGYLSKAILKLSNNKVEINITQ